MGPARRSPLNANAAEQPSRRVVLGRYADRGWYDFETIAAVLDDALICHVGIVVDGYPVVLPTIYGRSGKYIFLHGSALARWLRHASDADVCVTVSIIDALVLARSAYQHSLNYRSVVALARAQSIKDPNEKLEALRVIVEHVCRGRWDDVRPPTIPELNATLVLRVGLDEASAKIRCGPAEDFKSDLASQTWAGLVPLRTVRGAPEPDPALAVGIALPPYLS